jgi:dihydrolipoamide dehydrogenase
MPLPKTLLKLFFDANTVNSWVVTWLVLTSTEMITETVVARKLETTGMGIIKSVHPHQQCQKLSWKRLATAYIKYPFINLH